jgi:hypothetical protein
MIRRISFDALHERVLDRDVAAFGRSHVPPFVRCEIALANVIAHLRECAGMSLEGVTLRLAEMQLP